MLEKVRRRGVIKIELLIIYNYTEIKNSGVQTPPHIAAIE